MGMAASSAAVIGIIGGSGLYQIDGLTDIAWRRVASPFGETSDEFCFGTLGGTQVVFLPRHGRGHRIPPSEINYRANIDALKRAGVTDLISLSAVGIAEAGAAARRLRAGRSVHRPHLCAREELLRHRSRRACVVGASGLRAARRRARRGGATRPASPLTRGGTYVCMEGPQFSTMAESNLIAAGAARWSA